MKRITKMKYSISLSSWKRFTIFGGEDLFEISFQINKSIFKIDFVVLRVIILGIYFNWSTVFHILTLLNFSFVAIDKNRSRGNV